MSARLIAIYDPSAATAPVPPPTNGQIMWLCEKASEMPAPFGDYVRGVCLRLLFERSLLALASEHIPPDVRAEDDPTTSPAWVAYIGDVLRSAGMAKPDGEAHWALTVSAVDPAEASMLRTAAEARLDSAVRAMVDNVNARLAELVQELPTAEERDDAIAGGMLTFWPRGEDGETMDATMPVGVSEGALAGPAASRLEKVGLITWTNGSATLTERGRRAGQLHSRLSERARADLGL